MAQQSGLPHGLRLEERKRLTMNGVTEVVSFDEEAVVVKTALGILVVQGHDLKLKTLSPEGGQVDITGTVAALSYQEPKSAEGWLRRLFR